MFTKTRVCLIKLGYKNMSGESGTTSVSFNLNRKEKNPYPNSFKWLACSQTLKTLYPALLFFFLIEFLYPPLLYKLVKEKPDCAMLFQLWITASEKQSYFKLPTQNSNFDGLAKLYSAGRAKIQDDNMFIYYYFFLSRKKNFVLTLQFGRKSLNVFKVQLAETTFKIFTGCF